MRAIGHVLAFVLALYLVGCAGGAGTDTQIDGDNSGIIENPANAQSPTVRGDGTVSISYESISKRAAQLGVILGLVILGLLLIASAAPSPPDTKLILGLYAAGVGSIVGGIWLAVMWLV